VVEESKLDSLKKKREGEVRGRPWSDAAEATKCQLLFSRQEIAKIWTSNNREYGIAERGDFPYSRMYAPLFVLSTSSISFITFYLLSYCWNPPKTPTKYITTT
jgi:hypothetical protein